MGKPSTVSFVPFSITVEVKWSQSTSSVQLEWVGETRSETRSSLITTTRSTCVHSKDYLLKWGLTNRLHYITFPSRVKMVPVTLITLFLNWIVSILPGPTYLNFLFLIFVGVLFLSFRLFDFTDESWRNVSVWILLRIPFPCLILSHFKSSHLGFGVLLTEEGQRTCLKYGYPKVSVYTLQKGKWVLGK